MCWDFYLFFSSISMQSILCLCKEVLIILNIKASLDHCPIPMKSAPPRASGGAGGTCDTGPLDCWDTWVNFFHLGILSVSFGVIFWWVLLVG